MLFDTAWHDVGLVARSRPQNKPWRLTTDKHHGKRGLVDPLVPLLAPVPGIAGVISIVNLLSHAVLSDPLASLVCSVSVGVYKILIHLLDHFAQSWCYGSTICRWRTVAWLSDRRKQFVLDYNVLGPPRYSNQPRTIGKGRSDFYANAPDQRPVCQGTYDI